MQKHQLNIIKKNKREASKKAPERYQNLSKKKSKNLVTSNIKIFLKVKNKNSLSIEKNTTKHRKINVI